MKNDYKKSDFYKLKAVEKFGPLKHDECYTFVPALALGGHESVKNIQKVKIEENLEMLSQLVNEI